MAQVTIGPEYFKKEFKEYNDWAWAWVREILQNSIDAGSNNIEVTIEQQGEDTLLIVTNDGEAMTEEILVDKLLSLGSSGKNFENSVGGFGKAKVVLYFMHKLYKIRTGTLEVNGAGGDYELTKNLDNYAGTKSTILMDGDQSEKIKYALYKFASLAQWNGKLVMNGDRLDCSQKKGSPRRDLGFGKVYTNKDNRFKMVVRIGGIPMFTRYASIDRMIIVELEGSSDQVLTSNRDGLIWEYREQLDSFITELAVDKRKALKSASVPRYERFAGAKLGYKSNENEMIDVRSIVDLASATQSSKDLDIENREKVAGAEIGSSPHSVGSVFIDPNQSHDQFASNIAINRNAKNSKCEEERRAVTIGQEFIIKNESGMQIPDYYRPDSLEFSNFSKKLIRIWGRLLVEVHRIFNHEAQFAIGFIFEDGDVMAEYEEGPYGTTYYIAPTKIVEQSETYSRSFKRQWKLTDRNQLIATAVHEFVHGLGFNFHDDRYANKFTEAIAVAMDNRKRFNWCFRPSKY